MEIVGLQWLRRLPSIVCFRGCFYHERVLDFGQCLFYLCWDDYLMSVLYLISVIKVKVLVLVAQSSPILCDPMGHTLPGSSVHGISRQEYWIGSPFPFPGNLRRRDQTWVSHIAGRFFYHLSHQGSPISVVCYIN